MDEKEDAGKDASPWWKSIFQINKKLLPLKITLFMFSGAGYAVIPYLTIHMKGSVTWVLAQDFRGDKYNIAGYRHQRPGRGPDLLHHPLLHLPGAAAGGLRG